MFLFQITGCGHGIGKELAIQYGALGAIVVGWDLNLETCQNTCKEVTERGGKAHAYQCDVTNREQILELAKKVQKEVGDVTILVNNAGIMPCHPLAEHSAGEINKIFGINVLAHFWVRIFHHYLCSQLRNLLPVSFPLPLSFICRSLSTGHMLQIAFFHSILPIALS